MTIDDVCSRLVAAYRWSIIGQDWLQSKLIFSQRLVQKNQVRSISILPARVMAVLVQDKMINTRLILAALSRAFTALTAAKFGDRDFAAQAVEDDADLLLGRILLAGGPARAALCFAFVFAV
jgi:hypothetical protein